MQPFRIAICQLEAHDVEAPEKNLQTILRALDDAGAAGAQLVALPECSYPAYFLRDRDPYDRPRTRSYEDICLLLSDRARRYGYWLAVGVARAGEDGTLTNSALVFGPDGESRGHYDKSFLWHFDSDWFKPGSGFPVWDMGFANVGILICADGRMPEIARTLTLNGAEVILDLTAWVSSGRDTESLTNPQYEYFMPVRAYENGVWIAAADKVGTEAGTIVYAGRSCLIDPLGEVQLSAGSVSEALIIHDLESVDVSLVPRRPALYRKLTEPTPSLPITAVLNEPLIPAELNHRVAVVPSTGGFDASSIVTRYRDLRAQQADLVVFGGEDGPEGWQVALPDLESTVREIGGAMVLGVTTTGCSIHQSAVLITPGATTEHVSTHGRGIQLGETPSPVISTPAGNVAMLCGEEGLVPEVARALMLQGADILAWPFFAEDAMTERLIRTRSDENRIYVAAAWPGGGMVVAPTGAPLAVVPRGTNVAMAAQVNKSLARWKDMAPGTNVVTDREPSAYFSLLK